MSAPTTRYATRSNPFIRQWKVLLALRRCPQTLQTLADEMGCSTRTIRRDLEALEAVPLPVVRHEHATNSNIVVYRLGNVPAWPRSERTPIGMMERA